MTRRLLAIAFLLALIPAHGRAEKKEVSRQDLMKNEKKLEDVRKQIREEKKSVKTISEKETSVLGELESINKSLTAKRDELKKTEASLSRIRRDYSGAEASISRLERERDALRDRLKLRLRAMYKMRKGHAMNVLFSSASTEDLGRRHKLLTVIMDSDSSLISGYGKNLDRLESERKRLQSLYGELASARKAVLTSKNEAESVQREKAAFLSGIKSEKDRRIGAIRELEQAAAQLQDLLNELRAEEPVEDGGFGAMKGRLRMPVDGSVVSQYGKVRHPKFQTVTFNNGIVIEAPSGAAAKSVYDGRVAFVGWLKGYGQVMIIDHGGGFYTLFAHLSEILRDKGAAVKKGDEVGLVGETGPSASSGLYFEIRQKGVPRDPMAWFAEK